VVSNSKRAYRTILTFIRPISHNTEFEPQEREGEPFDFNAVPNRFYINIETVGGMEPDTIFQQGIAQLQKKLADVMHGLLPSGQQNGAEAFPGRPAEGGVQGMEQGFTTPYGGGANSAWGGGTTPYGATTQYGGATTPYGQPPEGW
jgi:DNA-directed RNA polymerase II subunit RPB3